MIAIGFSRSAEHGSHLEARGKQYGGFETDHVDVFIQADGILRFEIHVKLLAFADFHGRPVETMHDPPDVRTVDAVQVVIGHNEHNIASQQGGRFTILCMNRGFATPKWRFVHDIVMDEGEIVE